MTRLEKKFRDMEKEFAVATTKYIELHQELDKYRGVKLDGENLVHVNQILNDIQILYGTMYPLINFILQNYQKAAKYHSGYNKFIEDIKSGGAKPEYEVTQ